MMTKIISESIKELIEDENSIKLLTTVGKNGIPHAVIKNSLYVNKDGNLEYFELLEGSWTNKNLVYSLWFDKKVTITVITSDKRSFLIQGKPYKTIVAGKKFQEKYEIVKKWNKDSELAAIWVIEPESVKEETYLVRKEEERIQNPYYIHLDSIAKEE